MRRVIVGQGNIGEHEVGWRPTTREALHHQRLEAEMEREVPAEILGDEELHGQQRRHRDQRRGRRPAQFAPSGPRSGDELAKSELPAEDDDGGRCGKGVEQPPPPPATQSGMKTSRLTAMPTERA